MIGPFKLGKGLTHASVKEQSKSALPKPESNAIALMRLQCRVKVWN
jgi:hypothetical protein